MKKYEIVNALKCIAKSYIAEQHELPISQFVFEYIVTDETKGYRVKKEYSRAYCNESISINDIVTNLLSVLEKEYDLNNNDIHIDIPNGYQYYYRKLNAMSEYIANESVKAVILGGNDKDNG